VPVTDDFWPLYHLYLRCERPSSSLPAVWLTFRKGRGRPLTYATFESSIRGAGRRIGAHITAHMFRHTLAQAVLDATGNLKVVQELLGHAHISTTADTYVRVGLPELIQAVARAKAMSETTKDRMRTYWQRHTTDPAGTADLTRETFVFPYDYRTVQEFERLIDPGVERPQGDDG
jgi:Phage integrase family